MLLLFFFDLDSPNYVPLFLSFISELLGDGNVCERAVITRELVGVSRSDARVAPAGVSGGLEAGITCRAQKNQRKYPDPSTKQ